MNSTAKKIRENYKTQFDLFFLKFSPVQKIIGLLAAIYIVMKLTQLLLGSHNLMTIWKFAELALVSILAMISLRSFLEQVVQNKYKKKISSTDGSVYEEVEVEYFDRLMEELSINSKREIKDAIEYFEVRAGRRICLFKYYVRFIGIIVSLGIASIGVFSDKLSLPELVLLFKFSGLLLLLLVAFFIAIYIPLSDILNRESKISQRILFLLKGYKNRTR